MVVTGGAPGLGFNYLDASGTGTNVFFGLSHFAASSLP
jgi:hypothetical protein